MGRPIVGLDGPDRRGPGLAWPMIFHGPYIGLTQATSIYGPCRPWTVLSPKHSQAQPFPPRVERRNGSTISSSWWAHPSTFKEICWWVGKYLIMCRRSPTRNLRLGHTTIPQSMGSESTKSHAARAHQRASDPPWWGHLSNFDWWNWCWRRWIDEMKWGRDCRSRCERCARCRDGALHHTHAMPAELLDSSLVSAADEPLKSTVTSWQAVISLFSPYSYFSIALKYGCSNCNVVLLHAANTYMSPSLVLVVAVWVSLIQAARLFPFQNPV